MKLYIIPIEKTCNGNCVVCITRFKKETKFGDKLEIVNLSKIIELGIDKIEITGGGEPFLHSEIEKIIMRCSQMAPTQIYTNGSLLNKFVNSSILRRLSFLCVSRMHYNDVKNRQLMGVDQKIDLSQITERDISVKLSLVLCRSGISTAEEVKNYLDWAKKLGVKKVVIRQLFDFNPQETDESYNQLVAREYVSSEELFLNMNVDNYHLDGQGNPIFMWKDLEVEVEYRSCACEMKFPILRGNGEIYFGWTDALWCNRNRKED